MDGNKFGFDSSVRPTNEIDRQTNEFTRATSATLAAVRTAQRRLSESLDSLAESIDRFEQSIRVYGQSRIELAFNANSGTPASNFKSGEKQQEHSNHDALGQTFKGVNRSVSSEERGGVEYD